MGVGLPRESLTAAERRQLLDLQEAGAVDAASGGSVYALARARPLVLSRLQRRGLTDSRVVRNAPMSGQFTAYWLTAQGAALARALVEAAHG